MSTTISTLPKYPVQVTLDIYQQTLSDLITTAVEGGIGYWSLVTDYSWGDDKPTTVTVHESTDDIDYDGETIDGRHGGQYKADGVFVGPAEMHKALVKICDLTQPIEHLGFEFRTRVMTALAQGEDAAGYLDSGDCDIILQIAVLGEVVYG